MLKNFWEFCKLVFSLLFLFSFIFLRAEENIDGEKTTKTLNAKTQKKDAEIEDKNSERKSSEENAEIEKNKNDSGENSNTDADAGEKSQEKKTKQEEAPLEKNFSTMSETYVLLGNDGLWYYEKFSDDGNLLFARWYDKDKIVKEENYFYDDERLQKMEKVFEGKKTFYFYDDRKNIIRIEEKFQDKTIVSLKTYNEKNHLVKIQTENDGLKTEQKLFYKSDGNILREENYKDEILISIIEYLGEKKRVHLFDNGKEIKVFDD
ncbi:MAG: hypothetical protein P1P64_09510 [Treponemataceae bacterium]